MKTTLLAITLVGVTAAMAFATPSRNLNKRRAEKKRDANKAEAAAPARVVQRSPAGTTATAPGTATTPTAPAAKPTPAPSTGTMPSRPSTAPSTVAPQPTPSSPSKLARAGKPPSSRFFSRLRTDSSRAASKAKRDAAAQAQPAGEAKVKKNLIYRRTWGARARNRPR